MFSILFRELYFTQQPPKFLKANQKRCMLYHQWNKLNVYLNGGTRFFDNETNLIPLTADSFEKTLILGKVEGRRRRGQQSMRWLDGITDSMDSGSWWWTGRPGVLRFMGSQRVRHNWVIELNWTEVFLSIHQIFFCKTGLQLYANFS